MLYTAGLGDEQVTLWEESFFFLIGLGAPASAILN